MDPNEALRNARKALETYRAAQDVDDNTGEQLDAADELADAFEALNGWLSSGGFLPAAWGGR
jgi:hypothetical protein